MKIAFDARGDSYIEFKATEHGKIGIILSAKDGQNHLNTIINSAEITVEQMAQLVEPLGFFLSKKPEFLSSESKETT